MIWTSWSTQPGLRRRRSRGRFARGATNSLRCGGWGIWIAFVVVAVALAVRGRRAGAGTPEGAVTQPLQPGAYRQFALQNQGSASRGKALFNDVQRTACARCHAVDGRGGKVGPDLLGIGDKYPRPELIRATLEPSSALLPGYSTTIIQTRSGQVHAGVLKEVSRSEIELHNAGGDPVRLATDEIARRKTSEVSLMPEGLQAGITLHEFVDLIAYLETLRQPVAPNFGGEATPDVIARLAKPIVLRPFHSPALRFNHPVWFAPLPGLEETFVVLEHQEAKVWLLEKRPSGDAKSLFGDFDEEVSNGPFEGLMSIAFHPRFRENRKYYLKYEVVENRQRSTVVAEKLAAADYKSDSGVPSRRLLTIDQPAENHNGGTLAFGPDGYLYVGMGDGGPQEDPLGRSQNLKELLGKMLRIDVDGAEDGKPYAIPPANPFRRAGGQAKPETWAVGFREPWRFSFDRETGELWLGDVGQNRFEEVAIVRAGENHGWNVYEGLEPFSSRYRREGAVYVPPVVSLVRKHGVSVTGGYVYRGKRNSSFRGVYVFADFESRRIWGLTQSNRKLTEIREIGTSPSRIASFGEDENGELYLVGYDDGVIYQLDLPSSTFD